MPVLDLRSMTESDVLRGIERATKMLRKEGGFRNGALAALVFGFGGGLFGAAALIPGAAAGLMLGIAGAIGVGGMVAVSFTARHLLGNARQNLSQLQAILPQKTNDRLLAEAEATRLQKTRDAENEFRRKQEAQDKFNAAVDAGLPLEAPVRVGKTLRFKGPKKQTGFLRVAIFGSRN